MPCYRFDAFVLSPRRRALFRNGLEQPLIPRYFDLLLFLVQHRGEAVHRRDIFDAVWSDVIVSDSALSQAIRTIRRTLGDDSREPRFVRTVSRHGYQFVAVDVVEEDDGGQVSGAAVDAPIPPDDRVGAPPEPDPYVPLLARIRSVAATPADEEEQLDAAERLHALGTAEALRRLGSEDGHARARALLRDTRWDAPASGAVPILGAPGAMAATAHIVRLRLARAARLVARRWATGAAGGGFSGAFAGCLGALMLTLAPGSTAPVSVIPVLATIGAILGALAGAGVGAGLSTAEATMRSNRRLGLWLFGALGGGLVGLLTQWLVQWSLAVLVGIEPAVGGALDGLVLGGAAGVGYGLTTGDAHEGLATPRGRRRLVAVSLTGAACALAALGLSLAGRPLVGGTIHAIASASGGAQAMLTPLANLMGETHFGPITAAMVAMGEGAAFGLGIAAGLTRRG